MTVDEFSVVVDRELLRKTGKLEIDYSHEPYRRGFEVTANNTGGGNCA